MSGPCLASFNNCVDVNIGHVPPSRRSAHSVGDAVLELDDFDLFRMIPPFILDSIGKFSGRLFRVLVIVREIDVKKRGASPILRPGHS